MFVNEIEIPKYLYLTEPISSLELTNSEYDGPVESGQNLTKLEYIYHLASGFKPHNSQYMGDAWFMFDPTHFDKICLYANVRFRFAYAGKAREQLNLFSRYNPHLKKLLQIRPSYNIKAKIQVLTGHGMDDDTTIDYKGTNVNEFVMEKQYWEEYINKKYFENDIKIRE